MIYVPLPFYTDVYLSLFNVLTLLLFVDVFIYLFSFLFLFFLFALDTLNPEG